MKTRFKTLAAVLLVAGFVVALVGLWFALYALIVGDTIWLVPLWVGVTLVLTGMAVYAAIDFSGYVEAELVERKEAKAMALDKLPDGHLDEFTMARVRLMWQEEADKLEELMDDELFFDEYDDLERGNDDDSGE